MCHRRLQTLLLTKCFISQPFYIIIFSFEQNLNKISNYIVKTHLGLMSTFNFERLKIFGFSMYWTIINRKWCLPDQKDFRWGGKRVEIGGTHSNISNWILDYQHSAKSELENFVELLRSQKFARVGVAPFFWGRRPQIVGLREPNARGFRRIFPFFRGKSIDLKWVDQNFWS